MANQPIGASRRKLHAAPASGTSLSTVDSFLNFQHKLGIGADNPLSSGTYGFNPITRNRTLLEWMYRGSWIAGLAVDLPADDMTREGVEFATEMPPQDSENIERMVSVLDIWAQVANVVRWARLYGGAIGVVLIDGQDPATPLRVESVGPHAFRGILVLDRWQVEPSLSDLVEELGPNLGLPCYYRVSSNAPALRGARIHHSRVAFRMTGGPLPYQQALTENLWGISVYERLYDRMVAYDSASTGAAQLIYKAYLRTLKVKGLREIVAQGGKPLEGLTAYVSNMRRFQGIEGMTVIDAEDEFNSEQHGAFSGLDDALVQFGQQVSGALQIPLVKLFGQSPAGLNSTGESDLRNYYDGISQQQERNVGHGIQLVYKLIARSLVVELPKGFKVKFRTLWELDDAEKATTAGAVVTAVTAAKEAGLISDQIAMKELRQSSQVTGIFTNITDADIQAADDQIGPPPGAEGLLGGPLPGVPGAAPGFPGQPPQDLSNGNPLPEIRPQGQASPPDQGPQGRKRLLPEIAAGS
jgi:uncharacterized protein